MFVSIYIITSHPIRLDTSDNVCLDIQTVAILHVYVTHTKHGQYYYQFLCWKIFVIIVLLSCFVIIVLLSLFCLLRLIVYFVYFPLLSFVALNKAAIQHQTHRGCHHHHCYYKQEYC